MIETPVVERESSAAPASAGGPPRFFALHETTGGALLAGTCGRGIARAGTDAGVGGGTDRSRRGERQRVRAGCRRRGARAAGRAGVLRSLDDGVTWDRLGPDGVDVLAVLERGRHPRRRHRHRHRRAPRPRVGPGRRRTARHGVPSGHRGRRRARRHRARGHLVGVDRRRLVAGRVDRLAGLCPHRDGSAAACSPAPRVAGCCAPTTPAGRGVRRRRAWSIRWCTRSSPTATTCWPAPAAVSPAPLTAGRPGRRPAARWPTTASSRCWSPTIAGCWRGATRACGRRRAAERGRRSIPG